ncbi:hypothetical protein MNV49_005105 [Pseudohyphozyma bogoriensis]|nr:hypothetical protein MNV49_005105 [Pseudohyphozyma bogoriensis]
MTTELSVSADANEKKGAGKRGTYASQACTGCKKRKVKCDAGKPSCTSCLYHGVACVYVEGGDGRKGGKEFVEALKHRINTLEELVAQNNSAKPSGGADDRAAVLQRRVLALERALSNHGISVSDALEGIELPTPVSGRSRDQRQSFSSSFSSSSAVNIPPPTRKRSAGWGIDDEDTKESWVTQLDELQLDEASGSLRFLGPLSTFSNSGTIWPAHDFPVDTTSPLSPRGSAGEIAPSPESDLSSNDVKFDWSRNLPGDLGITRQVHDNIIELFEAFFAPWCMVVDMAKFREDMYICLSSSPTSPAPPPRTPYYSPMLHNAILALGCCLYRGRGVEPFPPVNAKSKALQPSPFFHPPPLPFDQDGLRATDLASRAFYYTARTFMEAEVEQPMLSAVRGMFLIASFNSAHARPNLGFAYVSSAMRTASVLGLRVISLETQLGRDRCFYTAVVQDLIQDNIKDARADLKSPNWEEVASSLNLSLEAWTNDLPACLRINFGAHEAPAPHIITLQITFEKTAMLLNQPFYSRDGPGGEFSAKRCDAAAQRVIKLVELYDSVYGLNYAPLSSIQSIYVAAHVLLHRGDVKPGRSVKRTKSSEEDLQACLSK